MRFNCNRIFFFSMLTGGGFVLSLYKPLFSGSESLSLIAMYVIDTKKNIKTNGHNSAQIKGF